MFEDTFSRDEAQIKTSKTMVFVQKKTEHRHEKNVLGSFRPPTFKLACSAIEASMRLEILVTETRYITLSRQRTTKALIRLRGCAG